ncbi:MAG: hypothetical protein CMM10_10165 [Rhodospirillaceae bacterium]|nr:hypothetical protein [Rhodospirillaceae bacterium]
MLELVTDILSRHAHRIAGLVEAVLIILTAAGMVGLIVIWSQLESLLAPDESVALVRARIVSGLFSLCVPMAILIFLTSMRTRLALLLDEQHADQSTTRSAKYMWYLVMAFVIVIMSITANVVWSSFGDINFKQ